MDRRERRRRETVGEILAAALACMAEEGVGALNLSEVARRVGMRTPSLYSYFPSRLAVYDALFAAGMDQVGEAVRAAVDDMTPGVARLEAGAEAFVRWCVAHPVLAQLLFWRPVPGFIPSPESYARAEALLAGLRAALEATVAVGELGPAAASDEALALHTALVQGLVSQHLANEPDVPFEKGRFTALLPDVMSMFRSRYAP